MKREKSLPKPPAIFLMGPTACGKSELAVELALVLGCEIISVDSALVYRGMDIGTAKPTMAQRRDVPHHLIDILDPSEAFSTGEFRDRALNLMTEISQRGKIPLLAGGTMLYFNAVLNGLASLPAADMAVREAIDAQARDVGWGVMHERLAVLDPASAQRIHPNDPQRIQRALEVYQLSGRTMTELCAQAQSASLPFTDIRLILAPEQRQFLHQRIEQRFTQMLELGLLDEVRKLYQRGDLSEDLPAIRAVGYRQAWLYLQGDYTQQEMTERAVIATRQLAKRQFTWLRRQGADVCRYQPWEDDLFERVLRDIKPLCMV